MSAAKRCSRRFLVLFALAALGGPAFAAPALAIQDAPPWGYLYFFRTMRLYELRGEETHIGRLTGNDIVLTSERVSRRHALLRKTGTGAEFLDVGSSNGSRLNGRTLRPRLAEVLHPGDRLQLADELALYEDSLESLWRAELQLRLMTSIVKLGVRLPQDEIRKSFGREENVPSETEARVDLASSKVEIEHSVPFADGRGFPEGSGAFIGNVDVDSGTLRLSLWALAGSQSMTSRRASFSNLKHTTLRVSIVGTNEDVGPRDPTHGPWFPPEVLLDLLEVFPDDPEYGLRFAHALSDMKSPVALQDAAQSFAFRFELDDEDPDMLARAARLQGLSVDAEVDARGISLKAADKKRLQNVLESARRWLASAKELGADEDGQEEAMVAIRSAEERLARLQ